jgi:hypothetical protein
MFICLLPESVTRKFGAWGTHPKEADSAEKIQIDNTSQ